MMGTKLPEKWFVITLLAKTAWIPCGREADKSHPDKWRKATLVSPCAFAQRSHLSLAVGRLQFECVSLIRSRHPPVLVACVNLEWMLARQPSLFYPAEAWTLLRSDRCVLALGPRSQSPLQV